MKHRLVEIALQKSYFHHLTRPGKNPKLFDIMFNKNALAAIEA